MMPGYANRRDGVRGPNAPQRSRNPAEEIRPEKDPRRGVQFKAEYRQYSGRGVRRKSAVLISAPDLGRLSSSPAAAIAGNIRAALRATPVPDIKVYGADGELVRVLDGLSKAVKWSREGEAG